MVRALQELNVGGVRTGAPAALLVLEDERFRKGDFDTHFLTTMDLSNPRAGEDALVAASPRSIDTCSPSAARWRRRRRRARTGSSAIARASPLSRASSRTPRRPAREAKP